MKVILVHLDRPEEIMVFSNIKELPPIIKMFSMSDSPLKVKLYRKIDILRNGLPIYHQFETN